MIKDSGHQVSVKTNPSATIGFDGRKIKKKLKKPEPIQISPGRYGTPREPMGNGCFRYKKVGGCE